MTRYRYCPLAAALVFAFVSLGETQEKKAEDLFEFKGELTSKDPPHKVNPQGHAKIHPIKLVADKGYRIDLRSKDFDALLILVDDNGKIVAGDDDSAGGANLSDARVLYRPAKGGEYRLVVTSSPETATDTGKYTIVGAAATAADLLILRARAFSRLDRDERNKLLDDLIDYYDSLGKKIDAADASLAMSIGSMMEELRTPGVGAWYLRASKAIAVSEDAGVKQTALILEGCSRRVRLPGNTMALKGTKLDGQPLNWDAYRGKIVLVDFWATWCGPCIRELPNIRRMHAAYKDKGFDVVAVCLDDNYEALETFISRSKEGFPWACIFEKNTKRQPLGDYYGVTGIPLPILVDKAGKVISMEASGPELERLLETHLGAAEKK
jgi:thiol-disulfide isomerase/thioredoxin